MLYLCTWADNRAAGRRPDRKPTLAAVKKRWKSVRDKFPLVDGILSESVWSVTVRKFHTRAPIFRSKGSLIEH